MKRKTNLRMGGGGAALLEGKQKKRHGEGEIEV